MKKLLISFIVAVMSLSAMATQTGFVRITLNGENGDTDYASTVVLVQDDARTTAYESGYDAELLSTTPSGVYGVIFYGFVGTKKCEYIYANDFVNQELGFVTNVTETNYTLTFSDFSGEELDLYDKVLNSHTTINASTPVYNFTATAGRVTVENRFVINYNPYYVTTNAYGWASYSNSVDLALPTGLVAYKGAWGDNNESVTLTSIADIPANTGVFVKGEASTTYFFSATTATATVSDNVIVANVTAAAKPATGTTYVLHDQALYEYTGTDNIPANKAYLHVAASSNAPQRIRMVVGGTQGVENVEAAVKSEKLIRDGQIVIIRNGVEYNAAGQIIK